MRRLRPAAIAVLSLTLAGVSPALDASAINVFGPANTESYPITVKVEVYGPDRDAKVRQWRNIFEDFWGQDFYVGCRKVELKLEIVEAGQGGSDYHPVTSNPVLPGDYHVSSVFPGDTLPTEDNYLGRWSSNAPDQVIAHEMGHLLGLPDEYLAFTDGAGNRYTFPNPAVAPEYTWTDTNGNGEMDRAEVWIDADGDNRVDSGELTRPTLKPGQTPSIMAESGGKILPRHIKEIVKKNVPGDQQRCQWKGTFDHGGMYADALGLIEFSANGPLSFEEDADGLITGTAELTLTYINEEQPGGPCGGEGRWRQEPLAVTLAVTGQRTGPNTLKITFGSQAMPEIIWEYSGCGITFSQPVSFWQYMINPDWPPALHREESRYVVSERFPQSQGDSWIEIVVEPVDEPGIG